LSDTCQTNECVVNPTLLKAKRSSRWSEAGRLDGNARASGKYSSTNDGVGRDRPAACNAAADPSLEDEKHDGEDPSDRNPCVSRPYYTADRAEEGLKGHIKS
jgi:hypothetical protein